MKEKYRVIPQVKLLILEICTHVFIFINRIMSVLDVLVFSSLAITKLPIVERQAFIFPSSIEYMQETITEKGITSKHIIGM